jgi:cytochrome c biogenesis protein
MENFFKSLERVFLSLKTTIFLLFTIALVSMIGTIIPQQKEAGLYIAQYGETLYQLFHLLSFFNIYGSWWFQLLLFLLIVNLVVCTLQRLPRVWKGESASKKEWVGGLGPHLTHFSLIVILAGSLVGNISGFKGYVNIPQGELIDAVARKGSDEPLHLDFAVRCDKFEVTFYPGSQMPKEYLSELTILERGHEVVRKTIRVNDPLHYKGISFYQASYGFVSPRPGDARTDLEIIPKGNGSVYRLQIGEGETKPIPGTNYRVELATFIPDFSLGEGNRIISRSDQPNNPAVLVNIHGNEKLLFQGWSFLKFPDFHGSKDDRFRVKFLKISGEGKPYTGLMVVKDPGVWIVWTGFGMLVLGLYLSFHLRRKTFSHHKEQKTGGKDD